MTTVEQAKDIAHQWVTDEARNVVGFRGAYVAGSAIWLPDEATLPPTSDVDLTIVLDTLKPPDKIGKFRYQGILLDVSHMSADQLGSPDAVLSDYHLAGTFRHPGIIADPTGDLAALQSVVARDFGKRQWVFRRCEHARDKILSGLGQLSPDEPLPDNVLCWLFPTGVTTHILLVAGLRSPTIRQRYLAVRDLLFDYGQPEVHELLLDLLECATMSASRAAHHLAALTEVFDAASATGNTAFPFSSDISAIARPIAIDGSRDLIERGDHREAVFWMVVTYSRCQKILDHEALALRHRFDDGYRRLLGDLGIMSFPDLQARAEAVRNALPGIMEVAESIIDANPAIEHG
jgi:hypothetical protein